MHNIAIRQNKEEVKQEQAHYCIVRADLSYGTQAAMLIHAAGESSKGDVSPHTYAIALTCKNEKELEELSFKLFTEGVQYNRIIESDAPYTNQLMAIGVVPGPRSKLKKLFSNLPLLK